MSAADENKIVISIYENGGFHINQNASIPYIQLLGALEFAKQYLLQQGLVFIDQNVHCRQGEIDLIMKDNGVFVFVV